MDLLAIRNKGRNFRFGLFGFWFSAASSGLVLTGDDANHDRVPIRDGPDPDASANWTAPRDKPAGRPQLAVAPHKPAAAASHEAVAEPLLSAAAA